MPSVLVLDLVLSIDPTPGPHQLLHMSGRSSPGEFEELRLVLRCRHPGQGPDLGVGELPTAHRLGKKLQLAQSLGHSYLLPGGTQVEASAPVEPVGTGAKSPVPAALLVELSNHDEKAEGGGLDLGRELGDSITELVDLRGSGAELRCSKSEWQ